MPNLVAAVAATHPEALAVADSVSCFSYATLHERALRLAAVLDACGVGHERAVVLAMPRTPDLVVAMLAVWYAGGAFVPCDPALPAARLAFIARETRAALVLTSAGAAPVLPDELAGRTLCLAAGLDDLPPTSFTPRPALADGLAYVIYTSGSTGTPKGVQIPHRGLANLCAWSRSVCAPALHDRATTVSGLGFDALIWEIWPNLCGGASIHIPPEEQRTSPGALLDWLATQRISLTFLPTPLAEAVLSLLEHTPRPDLSLRILLTGGDRLQARPRPDVPFSLINNYGPTETSVVATSGAVAPHGDSPLPDIGGPISNTTAYVLAEQGLPAPADAPGELYLGGVGVARGYVGRPDLTAERFLPDPFSGTPGARMYRTGDLVRWQADGRLGFLGRIDQQVKLRGFRIELGEIEATLRQQQGVAAAVVELRTPEGGEPQLVAYLVPGHTPAGAPGPSPQAAVEQLRTLLGEQLPVYMIPSSFVWLDELPLTPNGKVDRRALPDPDPGQDAAVDATPPRTPLEATLAELWAAALGLPRVGVHAHFLALGGHSLLAARLIAEVNRVLGAALPTHTIWTAPTVAQQAALLAERLPLAEQDRPIPSAATETPQPLSFAQQRLLFQDMLLPGSPIHSVVARWRLAGPLDVAALAGSLNAIVERHAILRSTFVADGEQPTQQIHPRLPLTLSTADFEPLPESERAAAAQRWITDWCLVPFDLAQLPLLRVALLRLAPQEHVLVLLAHHIVFDEWSADVFARELRQGYAARAGGRAVALPELPIQYADYARWQRAGGQRQALEAQRAYWQRQLQHAPVLDLPVMRPRPTGQTYTGARHLLLLPEHLHQAVKALCRQEAASEFALLLAALKVLLYRYSGQTDLSVGAPVANRSPAAVGDLIGFFVNLLVLRSEIRPGHTFQTVLRQEQAVIQEAQRHQDVPFEQLVDALAGPRPHSHSPLFQVAFVHYHGQPPSEVAPGLRMTWEATPVETGTAKYDLTLYARVEPQGLLLELEYNVDLFDASTVAGLAEHYRRVLEEVVRAPALPVGEIALLSPAQRRQILVDWNATRTAQQDRRCFHTLIEAQAARRPDATAVVFARPGDPLGSQRLTYRELDQRANQLARYLSARGVGPEVLVGMCVERSLDLVVGLLGVLKAGGAFVPLDPVYPADRIDYMLDDTGAPLILTQEHLRERVGAHGRQIVCLDTDWPLIAQEAPTPLRSGVSAENLAYVIYTSGSSGRPKGVQIAHRGIGNLSRAQARAFGLGETDRVAQWASFNFDASVFDLVMALCTGASLHLGPREAFQPGPDMVQFLREQQISNLTITPSAVGALPDHDLPALRKLIVAGEACPADLVARWAPGRQFFNAYGPTETTVWASVAACRPSEQRPSIGGPIDNVQLYVLDERLLPVPVGVAGELYIGSIGLARGYQGRPDLTAERFIPNPFLAGDGPVPHPASLRLYKTGDRARWLPDGALDFLGRLDDQVKIRGFRIELGEIERVLASHPAVREACVIVREDNPGAKRLAAYIVLEEPRTQGEPEGEDAELKTQNSKLKTFLQGRLPDYMVPPALVLLPALPLTANGKIDRRALPHPETVRAGEEDFVAPRTTVEQTLAGIWRLVLGLERVGLHDNFFELGGDSILALQVTARVKQAGLSIGIKQLIEHPTVAGLALVAEQPSTGGAQQGLVTGPVLLTPIQRWFFEQDLADPHFFNQALLLELARPLDRSLLDRALGHVLRHHDALRLRFRRSASTWEQHNSDSLEQVPCGLADLAGTDDPEQAIAVAAAELQSSFDLAQGPLLRALLFSGGQRPDLLLIAIHHLAVDGVSWRVLLEDIQTAYRQLEQGAPVQLPYKTSSYQQWAERLASYARRPELRSEQEHWLAPERHAVAALPADRSDGPNTVESTDTVALGLNEAETAALHEAGRHHHAQINEILLAGLALALADWTGTPRCLVDVEGHGREALFDDLDVSRTVGWFTTIHPLLLDTGAAGSRSAAVRLVKEQVRRVPVKGLHYGLLRYLSGDATLAGQLSALPQAEVSFNYLGVFDPIRDEATLFEGPPRFSTAFRSPRGCRQHLIELNASVAQGRLRLEWTYSRHIHHRTTIERLAAGCCAILRELIGGQETDAADSLTPTDFPLLGFSQDELDQAFELVSFGED
ncbi:MAG TPA: amino acid adenylation domain-containing protein [Roseiflexaceae bacterium]|nr:amino acid adenylation domain-containing protein [Roseiflexaceae bacterium]